MGIKGKIAWALLVPKVSMPLFQATYRELMNFLIQTSNSVEEINQKMKDVGFRVGELLLMDYADRIKKHAKEFHEFASTLSLAYRVNSGQDFTRVWMSDDKRTIKFSDDHCRLCEGVEITEMPGLQYCNLISGVFKAVMDLRGFEADAFQESCHALGDPTCTWTLKLI